MTQINLPEWAEVTSKGKVQVEASKFYPEILAELLGEGQEVDQYWLTVARSVMKMDIQTAIQGTDMMPEKGGALIIRTKDSEKVANGGVSSWKQSTYPEGLGTEKGAKDSRKHYKRIRNLLF